MPCLCALKLTLHLTQHLPGGKDGFSRLLYAISWVYRCRDAQTLNVRLVQTWLSGTFY